MLEGRVAAPLGHARVEAELAPQLHPGATHQHPGEKQLPLVGLHRLQPVPQPAQLGVAPGRPPLIGRRLLERGQGAGIGQLLQPGAAVPPFPAAALGGIQAEGNGHLAEDLRLLELPAAAPQGLRQAVPAQGRQPRRPPPLLQSPIRWRSSQRRRGRRIHDSRSRSSCWIAPRT